MDNLLYLQNKLSQKLDDTGWESPLRFCVKSSDFYDVLLWLHHEKIEGRRWTPCINDIFKPFQSCPFNSLKVIFVYPEPWLDPTLNNGLALSHNINPYKVTPFRFLFKELGRTVPGHRLDNADLSGWADQGVLLLNTSLTARIGIPNKHNRIWSYFSYYLLERLNREEDLVWVFFGESEFYETIDNDSHVKLQVPALPHDRNGEWETDIFNKVNEVLEQKNKKKINW